MKTKKKSIKFVPTNLKSTQKKKGVWRKIKFPLSEKMMYIPVAERVLDTHVLTAHLAGRRWEKGIAELLNQYAKSGSVAIDIGAYIGTHTYTLSDAVNNGKVIAFEPQPWACKCIEKTLKKNKITNVEIMNAGISNKKDKLHFCSDSSGRSAICDERKQSPNFWKERYDINVITLDSLNLKNVSVIKMDVEGHELKALQGAENTIKNSKPAIIVEIWKDKKRRSDVKKFLNKLGYTMKPVTKTDFLCVHKSKKN